MWDSPNTIWVSAAVIGIEHPMQLPEHIFLCVGSNHIHITTDKNTSIIDLPRIMDQFFQSNHKNEPVYNLVLLSPDNEAEQWFRALRLHELYRIETMSIEELSEHVQALPHPEETYDAFIRVGNRNNDSEDRVSALAEIIQFLQQER